MNNRLTDANLEDFTPEERSKITILPNEQKWEDSHDYKQAVYAANKFLDEPYVDPDDDIRTISRQFLRQIERTDYFRTQIAQARREEVGSMVKLSKESYKKGFTDAAEVLNNVVKSDTFNNALSEEGK